MYDLDGIEIFMSSDGPAFGLDPNGSALWRMDTGVSGTVRCDVYAELGVLVRSENTITKIGKDGSFWSYSGIDSLVTGAKLGPDNTIYVLTDSQLGSFTNRPYQHRANT